MNHTNSVKNVALEESLLSLFIHAASEKPVLNSNAKTSFFF